MKNDIPMKNIYNLFSNFGNISFICKKRKHLYIKFRTVEFAAIAFNYLNNTNLMSNFIGLNSVEDPVEALPKESEYCECLYYDAMYDRYYINNLDSLLTNL